jgi:hypothetical protein
VVGPILNSVAVEVLPPSAVQEAWLTGSEVGLAIDEELKLAVHRQHLFHGTCAEEKTLGDDEDHSRMFAAGSWSGNGPPGS